jgi:hypothetical protein
MELQGKGNMRRLQRGEMSRMDPRRGKHTDVHIGAPGGAAAAAAPATDDAAQKQIQKVQEQNSQLQKELQNRTQERDVAAEQLSDLQQRVDGLMQELAAAKEMTAEPMEPVAGLRVLGIDDYNEADGLVRLDCSLKPTTGPLAEFGAIIIPLEDLQQLEILADSAKEEEDDDAESKG